jgi:hypothetical protein
MKILATSYGGSHIKTIEPILIELSIRGHECIYMPQTVASIKPHLGIKNIAFLDYSNNTDYEILKYGKKLAIKHHNPRVMSYEESVVYLGTIFKELVSQIGEDLAWQNYNEIGLRACNPVRFMLNLLDIECPDFVIATNAPRMERALLNAAVIKRIPNICVVDFQGLRAIDWLKSPEYCDHIAVGAQVTIDKLIENGRSPKSIHLTGSPLFGNINKPEIIKFAKNWKIENNLTNQILILFIEQPDFKYPNLPAEIRIRLNEICKKNNYKMITRFHPSLKQEIKPKYLGEVISPASEMVEMVVNACDVCVTMTSTVGWMALMANKPLININLSSTSCYMSIKEDDGAMQVNSLENLQDALRLVLSDDPVSTKLEKNRKNIQKFDDSAIKIADLVEDIYSDKNEYF